MNHAVKQEYEVRIKLGPILSVGVTEPKQHIYNYIYFKRLYRTAEWVTTCFPAAADERSVSETCYCLLTKEEMWKYLHEEQIKGKVKKKNKEIRE